MEPSILFLEEVDTTQRLALDLVVRNDRRWNVVCADHQTAGRGRRGTHWHDVPGASLLASLILWDIPMPDPPGLVGIMTALATAQALEETYPTLPPVQLKYPNDLLLHGRKVGGVLVEIAEQTAIVGVGVNLAQQAFPPELESIAISVEQALGEKVDTSRPARQRLIGGIMRELGSLIEAFQHHPETLYLLWQGRDATSGRFYQIQDLPDQPIGTALGVEPDFRLRLRLPDGAEWTTYFVASVSL